MTNPTVKPFTDKQIKVAVNKAFYGYVRCSCGKLIMKHKDKMVRITIDEGCSYCKKYCRGIK